MHYADTIGLMKLLAAEFTINRSTGTIAIGPRQDVRTDAECDMVELRFLFSKYRNGLSKSGELAISMGSEVVVSGGNRDLKGRVVKRRFTHVWIKDDGKWKLLARHANNVCTN